MTQQMFELINGLSSIHQFRILVSQIVVIGNSQSTLESGIIQNKSVLYVEDIHACIKHLSSKFTDQSWWFIGDYNTANDLIWKGLIMDVYLSKSYALLHSSEWYKLDQYALPPNEIFNKTLVDDPSSDFELISTTRSDESQHRTIRHYIRRNVEESNILCAMNQIIHQGFKRPNRTGVDTRSLFGKQFEYKMVERINPNTGKSSYRLPLLTTKRMFVRGVFEELKWFLHGGTDSKTLEDKGVNIWKGNSSREFLDASGKTDYEEGECGPIYGFQWKHWGAKWSQGKHDYTGEGIDQIQQVIDSLQTDPFSRRHIVSAWNVEDINEMCLAPCHVLYQFLVHEEEGQKYLTLSMYQRSNDVFLGLPFNICSLGLFLTMMAHRVNMKPFKIIHSIADFHIYENHIEAVSKQLTREPCMFPYITINCDPKEQLEDYEFKDIEIQNYFHHNGIKADMVA